VPRPDDYGSYKSSSDTPSLRAEKYPDDAPRYVSETEPYSAADSPEAYVRVILSDGVDDGGPGRIVEGRYSILNGLLQLTDLAGKHLASHRLSGREDAAAIARALLRKHVVGGDFYRPLERPNSPESACEPRVRFRILPRPWFVRTGALLLPLPAVARHLGAGRTLSARPLHVTVSARAIDPRAFRPILLSTKGEENE
jgi:hypothetical protein